MFSDRQVYCTMRDWHTPLRESKISLDLLWKTTLDSTLELERE